MYSDERNRCSHRLGFPIRKSPDRRLLASSRGLSQLTTSFIASLRQGIHTHALSSLTIKSISNTKFTAHNGPFGLCARIFDVNSCAASPPATKTNATIGKLANTCSKYCPSNIRLSKTRLLRSPACAKRSLRPLRLLLSEDAENQHPAGDDHLRFLRLLLLLAAAPSQPRFGTTEKHGGPG